MWYGQFYWGLPTFGPGRGGGKDFEHPVYYTEFSTEQSLWGVIILVLKWEMRSEKNHFFHRGMLNPGMIFPLMSNFWNLANSLSKKSDHLVSQGALTSFRVFLEVKRSDQNIRLPRYPTYDHIFHTDDEYRSWGYIIPDNPAFGVYYNLFKRSWLNVPNITSLLIEKILI